MQVATRIGQLAGQQSGEELSQFGRGIVNAMRFGGGDFHRAFDCLLHRAEGKASIRFAASKGVIRRGRLEGCAGESLGPAVGFNPPE